MLTLLTYYEWVLQFFEWGRFPGLDDGNLKKSIWSLINLAPIFFSLHLKLSSLCGCHDILHNDIQHNDIQHNDIQQNDILHNDIQHNDIQHNEVQHNGIQHNDIQHKDIHDIQHTGIQHNDIQHNYKNATVINTVNYLTLSTTSCWVSLMFRVVFKPIMQSVILLSAFMLNVVAPNVGGESWKVLGKNTRNFIVTIYLRL